MKIAAKNKDGQLFYSLTKTARDSERRLKLFCAELVYEEPYSDAVDPKPLPEALRRLVRLKSHPQGVAVAMDTVNTIWRFMNTFQRENPDTFVSFALLTQPTPNIRYFMVLVNLESGAWVSRVYRTSPILKTTINLHHLVINDGLLFEAPFRRVKRA